MSRLDRLSERLAEPLDALRRACASSDRAYAASPRSPSWAGPRRTIAWTMERLLRENGGEGLSFCEVLTKHPKELVTVG